MEPAHEDGNLVSNPDAPGGGPCPRKRRDCFLDVQSVWFVGYKTPAKCPLPAKFSTGTVENVNPCYETV
jgi:hypothetical protein